MTPIADMVERMLAASVAHDVIVLAIRTAETVGNALPVTLPATLPQALPPQRSRKAVNQANYRARKAAKSGESVALAANPEPITPPATPGNAVTGNVTSAPLSILSSLTESQRGIQKVSEEKKKEEQSSEPREKRTRGARLPDDWEPSEVDRKFAADRGMRLIDIEIEATKFRNYWTNRTDKQAAKPRWDRAWQNWILNVRGTTRERNSVVAASDRLNAKLAEFGRKDADVLTGVRSGEGPSHVRLLSSR